MSNDVIPAGKGDRLSFLKNLSTVISANAAAYGVAPAVATTLASEVSALSTASAALPGLQAAYHAGVDAENTADQNAVATARLIINTIQHNPAVTDAMKAAVDLKPYDKTRTPNPPPSSLGIIHVTSPQHGDHKFMIEDTMHSGSAKPKGYAGFELWEQIGGTPPVTNAGMTLLGTQTKTRFTLHQDVTNSGKMFYFIGRWVNTTGEYGQWSTVASCVLS